MNQIAITIMSTFSGFKSLIIDVDHSEIRQGEKKKIYDKEEIMKLYMMVLDITKNWKEKYEDLTILDGPSFKVVVTKNNMQKCYQGNSSVPSNFKELIDFIEYLERDLDVNRY